MDEREDILDYNLLRGNLVIFDYKLLSLNYYQGLPIQ